MYSAHFFGTVSAKNVLKSIIAYIIFHFILSLLFAHIAQQGVYSTNKQLGYMKKKTKKNNYCYTIPMCFCQQHSEIFWFMAVHAPRNKHYLYLFVLLVAMMDSCSLTHTVLL